MTKEEFVNEYDNIKMDFDIEDLSEMYKMMKNVKFNKINVKRHEKNKIMLDLTTISSDSDYDSDEDSNNHNENKSMRKITKHLGKFKKIKGDESFESCSICCNEYIKNEYYRKMDKCGHIFHKKCVDKWFFVNKNCECPLCRTNHNTIIIKETK
jgi:hypothetical protein